MLSNMQHATTANPFKGLIIIELVSFYLLKNFIFIFLCALIILNEK